MRAPPLGEPISTSKIKGLPSISDSSGPRFKGIPLPSSVVSWQNSAIMAPVPAERTQPVEVTVSQLLTEQKQTLAVAESCTGGLITHRLTNIPGSSVFMIVGVIAYAYEAKVIALGVSWDTLNKYGAVSEETALAMARGVRSRFSTSLGLSVTGIAGPGGATDGKPVGLTFIALVDSGSAVVERHVWQGDRLEVKEQSAQAALELLRRHLEQEAPHR